MKLILFFSILILWNVYFSQDHEASEYYSWGNPNGHTVIQLSINKIDSTFIFHVRDDIWFEEIGGVFKKHDDSLFFYKSSLLNLKEAIKEPFVIESNDEAVLPKGVYYTVSSTEGSALEGYNFFVNDSIPNKIEIILKKNDWIFKYQVKDKSANRYDFIIPFNFADIIGVGYSTIGIEDDNGDLVFGKYILQKEIIQKYEDKKKFRFFKRKNRY